MSLGDYKLRTSIAVSAIGLAAQFYERALGLASGPEQSDESRIYERGGETALHVYESPNHAGVAWFSDPDGNVRDRGTDRAMSVAHPGCHGDCATISVRSDASPATEARIPWH